MFAINPEMYNGDSRLLIITKEKLPVKTHIYQTDDETIFYFKSIPPARLYVKYGRKEIEGIIPEGDLLCTGTHGNALFLQVNEKKIHKAVFPPERGLIVSYERDILEHETISVESRCIRGKDGDKYTYRMYNDDRDGHIAEGDTLKRWREQRGIAFYLSQIPSASGFSVHKLGKTRVVIEAPDKRIVKRYSSDCKATLLYLAYGRDLIVLNSESMEFLPALAVGDIDYIADIVRVRDGIITLRTHHNGEFFVMTARLPEKYLTTGKLIFADLPGDLQNSWHSGNALLVRVNNKIYKAIITSGRFAMTYEREVLQGEMICREGTCLRRDCGEVFIYRISDHPLRDAVLLNESTREQLRGYHHVFIRKSTAYIITETMKAFPSVIAHSDTISIVEIPRCTHNAVRIFFNKSSPFIYIACGLVLYTFDTKTMQFLPALKVVGTNQIACIAGVCSGVITVDAGSCVATAQLPPGYFKLNRPSPAVEQPNISELKLIPELPSDT